MKRKKNKTFILLVANDFFRKSSILLFGRTFFMTGIYTANND